MDARQEEIHEKGFNLYNAGQSTEYKKIKISGGVLENPTIDVKTIQKCLPQNRYTTKEDILRVLARNDIPRLRAISNLYYNINGIYKRMCNLFAQLYRYDWYVYLRIKDKSSTEKIVKEFQNLLEFLDNSYIKKLCGDIALGVVKNGCYYGYLIESDDNIIIQELPVDYCRSLYSIGGIPAVEFNMEYFNTFTESYREKVLNIFPPEFKKGWQLYRAGKLPVNDNTSLATCGSWYLLDPGAAIKFNINGSDIPIFVNAIPSLLDLDDAQNLDKKKQMQKLQKILVQKLPMDKNNDLIFDQDEALDIHNNARQMLRNTVGVDIVTTFADIEAINLSDRDTATTSDDLEKIERQVFNAFGSSHNLFNTDGNLALEKSVLNDESTMRSLLIQFQMFFDKIVQKKQNNKKYTFKFYMLETTQYNYMDLSKIYKEQTQIGYSKMLPQVALGHSQSFIYNTAVFENEILELSSVMIPPLMSSTLNGEDVLKPKNWDTDGNAVGRPEKDDSEKSEKTIMNQESMS